MLNPVALIVAAIASVLGTWSTTLLWRVWHVRRLERRARRRPGTALIVPTISRAKRRLGIALAVAAAAGAAILGTWFVLLQSETDTFSALDALCYAVAWLLVMFGLGAAFVALWFDLSHGRRRCPRCWYDMSATAGATCTECGREARSERDLRRTRRAPRLLWVSALLLISAYGAYVTPLVRVLGWGAAVPTTVLILGMPWLNHLPVTIQERLEFGSVADWQEDLLEWRCRRTIARSGDYDQIIDAIDCLFRIQMDPEMPIVSARGQVAMVASLCGAQPVASAQSWSGWQVLPGELDPDAAQKCVPILREAMESGDPARELAAITCAARLGVHVEPLVPALAARVGNPAGTDALTLNACHALRTCGVVEPSARRAFLSLLSSPEENSRALACRMVDRNYPESRPLLEGLLDDPSDAVAGHAAAGLLRVDAGATKQRLTDMAMSRPKAARHFIDVLVRENGDVEGVALLERLLGSSDPAGREWGAHAAGALGLPAAGLLPRLREMSTDLDETPAVRSAAAAAVLIIEHASGE